MTVKRLLVLLDVYPGVGPEAWLSPTVPSEDLLVLTSHGFHRAEAGTPFDWLELGAAVENLADRVHERVAAASDGAEVYIGGQAPLPLFVHLGFRLSKFVGKQTFLARGPAGGAIEQFDLTLPPERERFFMESAHLAESSFGTGLLALYVDTAGRTLPGEAISKFLQGTGQGSLQLVEARTDKAEVITAQSAPRVALELAQLLSILPSRFPKRDGLALFVAGPVLLAFLVGRALNASMVGRVVLSNFEEQAYRLTYSLPFERKSVEIDLSPEGELRRVHAKEKVTRAIEQLRSEVSDVDIPDDSLLSLEGRTALAAQLKALRVAADDGGEFRLSFARGELRLGRGLLEAISKLDDTKIADLTKLFVLHELVHDAQGLRSTNFAGVGRASVALEQIDYLADAFALRTLLRLEARQGGPRANRDEAMRDCGVRLIEAILAGIEAFDSLEHGPRIERLTERRTRRYLIWHLQRSRAATVTELADLDRMLVERVAVELAPLMGRIDIRRHEKVVTQPTSATSLFAAVDGRLIRLAPSHDFDPHAVVESLRSYGRTPLEQLMNYLVEENRSVLAPWRP
jgi:hypothetical protein